MKRVRTITLTKTEGTQVRVFEVDLCEVGDGLFVVNFRHGRIGEVLREGSKTPLPVPLQAAEKVLRQTLESQRSKGFVEAEAVGATLLPIGGGRRLGPRRGATHETQILDARRETLLAHLQAGRFGGRGQWPVGRLAWRIGELRIKAAASALVSKALPACSQPLETYSVLWALGRCGDPEYADALDRARGDARLDPVSRRIARDSLWMLSEPAERARIAEEVLDELPRAVARGLSQEDRFEEAATALLGGEHPRRFEGLEFLYLKPGSAARRCLIGGLPTAEVGGPNFRVIRRLFKMAEHRGDAAIWGMLARHFDTASTRGGWRAPEGFRRPASRYFRARVARTLRRLGEAAAPEYVPMAVGLLLAYGADDAPWSAGSSGLRRTYAFGQVLYGRSKRIHHDRGGLVWFSYRGTEATGPQGGREESFPELWDAVPEALIELLRQSQNGRVLDFAATALEANRSAWPGLLEADLVALLGCAGTAAVVVGVKIALERQGTASSVLTSALLDCAEEAGRVGAQGWVRAALNRYLADAVFVAAMVISPMADTRRFVRELLSREHLGVSVRAQIALAIVVAIERLVTADAERGDVEDARVDIISEAMLLLSGAFQPELARFDPAALGRLIHSKLEGVQRLAARILEVRSPTAALPQDVLVDAMRASESALRAAGVAAFGQLPDTVLLDRYAVLVHLCTEGDPRVRAQVAKIIERLARFQPSFGASMLRRLAQVLLDPEIEAGRHDGTVLLIRDALAGALAQAETSVVFDLLRSNSTSVIVLGGELLARRVSGSELELSQIVELAHNPVCSVRQAAWAMLSADLTRVADDVETVFSLLDGEWDDAREYGFKLFGDDLPNSALSPELLIAICDIPRPGVQAFGRRLVTRLFEADDGARYLIKLSQHPDPQMQLFATNYLARFAGGAPERQEQLEPYFEAVLCAVHRGRLAKTRVMDFARREVRRDPRSAALFGRIMGRISATPLVGDRAAAIEILLAIKTCFPEVDVPLQLHPPRSHHAI